MMLDDRIEGPQRTEKITVTIKSIWIELKTSRSNKCMLLSTSGGEKLRQPFKMRTPRERYKTLNNVERTNDVMECLAQGKTKR